MTLIKLFESTQNGFIYLCVLPSEANKMGGAHRNHSLKCIILSAFFHSPEIL